MNQLLLSFSRCFMCSPGQTQDGGNSGKTANAWSINKNRFHRFFIKNMKYCYRYSASHEILFNARQLEPVFVNVKSHRLLRGMEVLTQCLSYVKHFTRAIFALFLFEDFWSCFFGRFKVGARYVRAESEKIGKYLLFHSCSCALCTRMFFTRTWLKIREFSGCNGEVNQTKHLAGRWNA